MHFNENTRVKIPAILHLCRLGYRYLSLKSVQWDESTNIFTDIFNESIRRLNPEFDWKDAQRVYDEIAICLENEDLGRTFYEKLINRSGTRLIDYEDFSRNSLHVVTELPCRKDDEEFRPDITLLINGMPLVFIEVKKPNNQDGILAEHKRIQTRFSNKKFRKFVNITQLMVFSNNMEYDNNSIQPIEGAFYATASYQKPIFNYFREEDKFDLKLILTEPEESLENFVLQDTNCLSIKNSAEFITNKNPDSPTHRICTSLLGDDYNSKTLFGSYIHKYYYNASIADGYTLRLIREEIETTYKLKLKEALDSIDVLKGTGDKKNVYAHHRFLEPMLEYIISDF